MAFLVGRRDLTVVTLSPAKMVSKTLVNLASRSRIRKRNEPIRSPMLMSTFRGAGLHLPARRIRRTVASLI